MENTASIVVEAYLPRRCMATVAARTTQKTPFFHCCMRECCGRYLATADVYSHSLATGLYATGPQTALSVWALRFFPRYKTEKTLHYETNVDQHAETTVTWYP
jgi:hypothetical protein